MLLRGVVAEGVNFPLIPIPVTPSLENTPTITSKHTSMNILLNNLVWIC